MNTRKDIVNCPLIEVTGQKANCGLTENLMMILITHNVSCVDAQDFLAVFERCLKKRGRAHVGRWYAEHV